MKSIGLKYSLYLVLVTLLAGCSAAGSALRSATDWSSRSLSSRYESLVADTCDWQTISFSGNVKMTSPEKHSGTAKIFMIKDSLIHISLRAYGVEGAVIRLTPDSVKIYDKVDKVLMSATSEHFFGNMNLSISDIQQLMLGRYPTSLFQENPEVYALKTDKQWGVISSVADGETRFRREILIDTPLNLPAEAKLLTQSASSKLIYSKWKDVADVILPTSCELMYSHTRIDETYTLKITISIGSLKINQGQTPRWRVGRETHIADFDQIKYQLINTMQ